MMKKNLYLTLIVITLCFSINTQAKDMKLVLTLEEGSGLTWTQPLVGDLDNDGLVDLIILQNGDKVHYEQVESGAFSFSLSDDELILEYTAEGYSPTLTDLDGDGLFDYISYYSYNPNRQEQDLDDYFSFTSTTSLTLNGFDFSSHGRYADHATFADINGDGLLDMIMGYGSTLSSGSAYGTSEQRDGSSLLHFEQDSSGSNTYNLVTDYFNNITNNRCCSFYPVLVKLNPDSNIWDLITGEQSGGLRHYRQKEENSYEFELVTDEFGGIESDFYYTPAFYDLDGDNIPELILGRRDGEVRIYQCQDQLYYKDDDKDGYGDPDDSKEGCYLPVGNYVANNEDAFPSDSSEYLDTDGDGIGNNADTDDDGDGIPDEEDSSPLGDVSGSSSGGGGCSLNLSISQ